MSGGLTGGTEAWEPCSFFQIDGIRLAGRLYGAAAAGAATVGIVFAHGFGGTQDVVAPAIAAALVAATGGVVLTFDYAGFGASDGQRHRIDPQRQVRDCRAALAWLRHRCPDLDEVGLVGLSLGGAVAVAAAAHDPRVAFVAGINAVADGEQWMRDVQHARFDGFVAAVEQDAVARLDGGRSAPAAASWIVPRTAAADVYHAELQQSRPGRDTTLDVASAALIMDFHPLQGVDRDRLAARCLFVHADDDFMAPLDHAHRLAAATGGRIEVLAHTSHYDVYDSPAFERLIALVSDHALANSRTHLRPTEGVTS